MPSFDAGQTGITPGVTILTTAGAVHTARATAGITEPVAGSGVYFLAHPDPGTLLLFVFDGGVGTVGASVWDDGVQLAPKSTALSNATWTNTKAGYIDAAISDTATQASVDALGSPMQTGDATVAGMDAKLDVIGAATAIAGDVTINETTRLDAGGNIVASPLGTAIGPVTIEGVATGGISVTAYLTGTLTNPKRRCESESDGGWSLGLTPGATYDVVFGQDDGIETPVTVTVIVE